MFKKKTPLPFNINDVGDAETVDYNNDTNINDVLSSKNAQIAAKKIVKKYKNLRRKRNCTFKLKEDIEPIKIPKFPTLMSEIKTHKLHLEKYCKNTKKYHEKVALYLSIYKWCV